MIHDSSYKVEHAGHRIVKIAILKAEESKSGATVFTGGTIEKPENTKFKKEGQEKRETR